MGLEGKQIAHAAAGALFIITTVCMVFLSKEAMGSV